MIIRSLYASDVTSTPFTFSKNTSLWYKSSLRSTYSYKPNISKNVRNYEAIIFYFPKVEGQLYVTPPHFSVHYSVT